eukprot:scaffold89210_cov29-Tisochrysis_lutea.AAC.4
MLRVQVTDNKIVLSPFLLGEYFSTLLQYYSVWGYRPGLLWKAHQRGRDGRACMGMGPLLFPTAVPVVPVACRVGDRSGAGECRLLAIRDARVSAPAPAGGGGHDLLLRALLRRDSPYPSLRWPHATRKHGDTPLDKKRKWNT